MTDNKVLQAEKQEIEIYTAPDGKKFLDPKEANFYIEKLKELVLNHSVYRVGLDYVPAKDEKTPAGYARDILVLVDKAINDTTNVYTVSTVLLQTLGAVPYTVSGKDLVSNFDITLEVPRVDKLQDVESWDKVHEIAAKFLSNDTLRMAENEGLENPEDYDSVSSKYATLLLTKDFDTETGVSVMCYTVNDESYMRNTLRIIAGDKPYVSAN